MKKTCIYLILLGFVATGCKSDTLFPVDFNPWSDTSSGTVPDAEDDISSIPTSGAALDSEDDIAETKFSYTIQIHFSDADGATVTGDKDNIVAVSGNDVTVNNTPGDKIAYELSGSASNGFLKIYSSKKQALILNGLDLTNKRGAAINNQGKKRCFVVVQGTNKLADGPSYTLTPDDEDEKAAFFSEGQLIFSGDGSLTVTATGKAGITSDDYIRFMASPTVKVSSTAGHGIRGKDAVIVSDGTLYAEVSADMKKAVCSDSLVRFDGGATEIKVSGGTAYDDDDNEYKGSAGVKADQRFEMNGGSLVITNSGTGGKGISGDALGIFAGGTVDVTVTGGNYGKSTNKFGGSSNSEETVGAKGIKFDGDLFFTGSTVTVSAKNHEGIEAKGHLAVTSGSVCSQSSDDAINSGMTMSLRGGYVCALSSDNDGIDANGNLFITGGLVYASGSGTPEVAIDANTEGGYHLYFQGGTLIAIGGLEKSSSLKQDCWQASSWSGGKWYSFTAGSASYAFMTPSKGGSGLVVSASAEPTLKSGVTVSGGTSILAGLVLLSPTVSGGSDVTLSTYTSSSGGGFGPVVPRF